MSIYLSICVIVTTFIIDGKYHFPQINIHKYIQVQGIKLHICTYQSVYVHKSICPSTSAHKRFNPTKSFYDPINKNLAISLP